MSDINDIVEAIKTLKMWELRELIIAIEEHYGVAAPGGEHLMANRKSPEHE